jgi:hypothetical protein
MEEDLQHMAEMAGVHVCPVRPSPIQEKTSMGCSPAGNVNLSAETMVAG